MNNYKSELDKFYSLIRVLNVPLEKKCKFSRECWTGIEDRMQNDDVEGDDGEEHFSHLYIPWIGSKYDVIKLLVIGINMNNYGGYRAEEYLAEGATKEILEGHRKIRFGNPDYAGTFYWHRIPAYVVLFLEKEKLLTAKWEEDDFPSNEDVSLAFKYFAITNQIKCSPIGNRSKPTYQMWGNCGNFILREEIKIIKPHKILICGKDNFDYFNKNVLDKPCNLKQYNLAYKGFGEINSQLIEIYKVPHPTSFGGNSVEIMYSLKNAINAK